MSRLPSFVLLVLALSACPPRVPLNFGEQGEPRTAQELLKRVELAESQLTSIVGDAKLSVDVPQGKGAVGMYVGVALPASLHLEQIDFFNRPQAVLITDGTTFGLYDAQAGKFMRGPATAENLSTFLPIVLPPGELTQLLLGRVPRLPADAARMSVDAKRNVLVLELFAANVVQRLEISPPSYRVVKSTVEGMNTYDAEFSELTTVSNVVMPKRLVLKAAAAKLSLELTYKDVTINQTPDPSLFDLSPPDNVPVSEVDATGLPRQAAPDAGTRAP